MACPRSLHAAGCVLGVAATGEHSLQTPQPRLPQMQSAFLEKQHGRASDWFSCYEHSSSTVSGDKEGVRGLREACAAPHYARKWTALTR